ncbi:MAG TPA: glycosyltransferase, partial [Dissulfurispiraceae bacterium]|nr:glycosyltransferase [Dissulfurispiraceae bacterium]
MEIFLIFAALSLFALIAYGLQIRAARAVLNEKGAAEANPAGGDGAWPPVSILKPLKGLDDNLFDNLESFCLQDYPEYEVIFSLQDRNDQAHKVAEKVRERHPDKNITIITERSSAGLNPKINNLIPAYRVARYDHVLISDSNVMVGRDYLREIMGRMSDQHVGLVSNLIKGTGGRTIGSVLENLHLNSFIMGSVCFLDRSLGMPCVVGKSMLFRKGDLEKIGGLRSFKDVLAEDYLMGKRMHEAGKKVVLSGYMVENVNDYWGFRRFLNRHTRWGKLRWRIGGIKYVSEILTNAVFLSSMPLILWEASLITCSFAAAVSSLKIMGDLYIGRRMQAGMNSALYLLSPVKDFIIGILWFVPLFSSTVVWRGNKYSIGKDSV